jgi:hypothetical protein
MLPSPARCLHRTLTEVELRAAKAREEVALIMPEVKQEPAEPEKKTPQPTTRRRRGRKKST